MCVTDLFAIVFFQIDLFLYANMNEKICRLCLQTVTNNNCQTLGESLLKTLKLNLKILKETVMCVECANCLRVFSKFSPRCAFKGDRTLPLSDLENGIRLGPLRIEATINPEALMKTEIRCSLCTEAYGREDLVSINDSNKYKFMMNMLEQYISEMNLNSAEELLTCGACLGKLEGASGVILKCLEVEEQISKYIELKGTDDKGQIELKEVQLFMSRPGIKLEIKSDGMDNLEGSCAQIKEEDTTMAELEVKYETDIGHTELNIKTDDIKSEQCDCDVTVTKSEMSDCDGLQEPFIENKTTDNLSRILVGTSEMGRRKKRIKQHVLTHKISSKTKMFHCETCSYDTKNKNIWRKHLLTHKNTLETKMFKCGYCSYQAKLKGNLKVHLLTHKSPSELKMFKCAFCSYEGKLKAYLDRHLLTHKSPSELKMFKCELCSYEGKQKIHLNTHLLTHRSPSELKMFKCELCPYESKRSDGLKRHFLLNHKSPSELKMFKCEFCPCKTKQKSHLARHLLTHRSPSERKMFKCKLCPYEAKLKDRLNMHLLNHKSPSELKMFRCELCPYEAKLKSSLKKHLLTHKSPSELNMFKCELCPYEAKLKSTLKAHLLTHKSPLELKMFKCELCSYESRRKCNLQRHLLTHKSSQS